MIKKKHIALISFSLFAMIVITVTYLIGGKGVFYKFLAQRDLTGMMSAESFTASNSLTLPYRMYTPEASNKKLPLLLYLHGSGPRGSDNKRQVQIDSIMQELLFADLKEKYPCYIIAPQCPKGNWWFDFQKWGSQSPEDFPVCDATIELVREVASKYNIDTSRIYITGLSMGGSGVWGMLWREPDLFAAAVPVCGAGRPEFVSGMTGIPIWAFHGAKDRDVDPSFSRSMINALRDAGSEVVKYTEYPGERHCSWEIAYREGELYEWMFSQVKR